MKKKLEGMVADTKTHKGMAACIVNKFAHGTAATKHKQPEATVACQNEALLCVLCFRVSFSG